MDTFESLESYLDAPDPLKLLCLRTIIKKPLGFNRHILPQELGILIAAAFREYALTNRLSDRDCYYFFKNFTHEHIPINRLDLSGLPITTSLFIELLHEYKSQLDEINISKCPPISLKDLKKLNCLKNNKNPKALIIGKVVTSLDECTKGSPHESILDDDLNVNKLVLHQTCPDPDIGEFVANQQLSAFLTPTMSNTLKYLDLSMCTIGHGSALMQLESLEILILYSCNMDYQNVVSVICRLTKLRVLDLSKSVADSYEFSFENEDPKLLDSIVTSLPHLSSLDISGTDLIQSKDRNISAFESRSERPFEFLGLFHTGNDAAYRSCIPAITVAGEATESQILNACEAYMDRPEQLSRALNDLYNLYKTITPSETFDNVTRALEVVLPVLTRHINDNQLIVFTTAALWCIVKIKVTTKSLNDAKVRRIIISRLLDVMHYHRLEKTILINGGLTLLFMPDIICEYSRVAAISLHMCRDSDPRTQGFGTTLMNALACQVGGEQKRYIGELKAIEVMVDIIKVKIEENMCDEILETAWSTLWNITDETPENCKRFLQYGGMNSFEDCMDKFDSNKEVPRNIMGLLGNVAECESLRGNFMHDRYIHRFESLLISQIDGIECSYNACGILAHLISDGESFWEQHSGNLKSTSRTRLMKKMCSAISRWPINSRRNINYRSFEPIIRLLRLNVAPASQYWATFALANLTRINPAKYCPMLEPNEGLLKLRALTHPGATDSYVINLAAITVYQYERFEAEQTLAGLEQSDSIDLEVIRNFRAESSVGDGTSELGEIIF